MEILTVGALRKALEGLADGMPVTLAVSTPDTVKAALPWTMAALEGSITNVAASVRVDGHVVRLRGIGAEEA